MHALVRPFCSGRPGSMRRWRMPSLIHHTESLLRPQKAGVANGAPLSVRMASGRPYSWNRRSKMGRASTCFVESRAEQVKRKRL